MPVWIMYLIAVLAVTIGITTACSRRTKQANRPPIEAERSWSYQIVGVFPHDPKAYTQGLVYDGEHLYESTGLRGRSQLRVIDRHSGAVLKSIKLNPLLFGEGLALANDKLVQLTWKARTGYVYDKDTLEQKKSFKYSGEGWGITSDGSRLIVSDGSSTLRFWDPETLEETGQITVKNDAGPVRFLNELEFIDGHVYANIWQSDHIVKIEPESGRVVGWLDLSDLRSHLTVPGEVLNGIAYDENRGHLLVTGKFWDKLFEIELR
ncbi:MAG: glutaminyl-peptide cyclotransferase [Verrucomicrobia bacterium]|nr:glutaminyl-peptide cyclotransferase [Verrucomicrobiota bacterium]